MITLRVIDMLVMCIFVALSGFFLWKHKKTHTKTTCAFVDRPIIPGNRKDGKNETPTSPKPHEYRPIIEGDRKDYNPPPTAPKPKEYRGMIGGDRKDYNSPPTSPKPDFLKPHLPLSSGLWGRKDRKDEPLGPKPITRPWDQRSNKHIQKKQSDPLDEMCFKMTKDEYNQMMKDMYPQQYSQQYSAYLKNHPRVKNEK